MMAVKVDLIVRTSSVKVVAVAAIEVVLAMELFVATLHLDRILRRRKLSGKEPTGSP